jgi:hypothetical protein
MPLLHIFVVGKLLLAIASVRVDGILALDRDFWMTVRWQKWRVFA